jgi:hypothetical protein
MQLNNTLVVWYRASGRDNHIFLLRRRNDFLISDLAMKMHQKSAKPVKNAVFSLFYVFISTLFCCHLEG